MARIQGLVGGMSGKMGNAVFRQRYGETIVSQYQPVVTNPNTSSQQVARAKFKLITQLASIMAPAMGTMGVINRPARQGRNPRTGFVQKNYNLMSAEPDETAAEKVTIPMEQIQLTNSLEYYGQITLDSPESNNLVVNIEIPASAGLRKKGKIALVGYNSKGAVDRSTRASVIQVVDVPFTRNSLSYSFANLDPGKYTVLSYGMYETGEGSVSLDYDNIHTPADEDYISQINIERAVSEGAMTLTETIGANIVVND